MTYHIELTNQAKKNIKKASTLNEKFTADLIIIIERLKENPLHHSIRYRGICTAHTKAFSFGIHFIINENNIKILNILHHKQFYK